MCSSGSSLLPLPMAEARCQGRAHLPLCTSLPLGKIPTEGSLQGHRHLQASRVGGGRGWCLTGTPAAPTRRTWSGCRMAPRAQNPAYSDSGSRSPRSPPCLRGSSRNILSLLVRTWEHFREPKLSRCCQAPGTPASQLHKPSLLSSLAPPSPSRPHPPHLQSHHLPLQAPRWPPSAPGRPVSSLCTWSPARQHPGWALETNLITFGDDPPPCMALASPAIPAPSSRPAVQWSALFLPPR